MVSFEPGSVFSPLLDLERGVRGIVRLVGWDLWKRRFDKLTSAFDTYPTDRRALVERHHIELCIVPAYERLRLSKLRRREMPDLDAYYFAAVVMRLYSLLSEVGKRELEGKVRDALNKDFGFASLRTELTTISFLHQLGCSVIPMDLEKQAQFDFLAQRKTEQVEVECKLFTDFATRISQSSHRRLVAAFDRYESARTLKAGTSVIVRVVLQESLPPSDGALRDIAGAIGAAVRAGRGRHETASLGLTLDVEEWPPGLEHPALAESEARWLTVVEGAATFEQHVESGAVVVAVWVAPEAFDRVQERVVRKFKDAANQLSGRTAGVIFAETEGPIPDVPVMRAIRDGFASLLPPFFEARPFVRLAILGFPGPPFSVGGALHIKSPIAPGSDSPLITELCDLATMEERGDIPNREFRRSWWAGKYDWDHKSAEDLERSLERRCGKAWRV